MNKNLFDQLSMEMQDTFRNAARSAIKFQRECARREEIEIRTTLEGMGCEITELTPDARIEFIDVVRPIIDRAKDELGQDLFNLIPKT